MQLFLVRHAHALEGTDDAARPLSRRGRKQIRTLARFLKRTGVLETEEIWHSPLVRAQQTAQALRKQLGGGRKLVEAMGLKPGDNPVRMARLLGKRRQSVALVGHEPHLSALASLLVAGSAEPPLFVLKKCAVLALARLAQAARLRVGGKLPGIPRWPLDGATGARDDRAGPVDAGRARRPCSRRKCHIWSVAAQCG
ncbi:MAG: phosphohistidine phosphatase SixA [Opitutales bacterium]